MDEPCTLLGKGHRVHRHDPIKTPPLAKELFGNLADEACLDHIRFDELESRRLQEKQSLDLTNQTSWFADFLFPALEIRPKKDDWNISNIRFVSIPVYYDPTDSHNTRRNVIDKLAEWAVERYGKENVNARIGADGDLEPLIYRGLDKKRVQIMFVDQFMKLSDPQLAQKYVRLDELWIKAFRMKIGLIVVLLATHTLKMPSVIMRNCGAIIFRNSPTTNKDCYEATHLLGEEAILYLKQLEQKRKSNNDLLRISLFWTKNKTGILETSLAAKQYWKEPMTYSELVKEAENRTAKKQRKPK
jgi:hypothetical protein